MSSVVFEGVTKRFGDVVAVDDLTLDIHDEEFMVLLGPSGCGKTTALRMIAGLDTVTEGVLRVGDLVVNDIEAKDRDIAMVFQSYALYPHMTVRQNIDVPLKARLYRVDGSDPRRLTTDERRQRADEALAVLGLEELADRKPGELSGGQRQRVALARAIVRRAEAFLMDEPLSNLDAKLRAQTRIELVDLHRRLETTFVYVTHDQVEAMTMADRIAILESGRLQQVGAPQAVYERPENLFVARFIGSPPMNTLPGTLVTDGDTTHVAAAGGAVPVPRPADAAREHGVVLGVRPEHLVIGDGALDASVVAVESLGHERHVYCDAGGTSVIVRQETAEVAAPAVGDAVRLGVAPERVHLFDETTTERLD